MHPCNVGIIIFASFLDFLLPCLGSGHQGSEQFLGEQQERSGPLVLMALTCLKLQGKAMQAHSRKRVLLGASTVPEEGSIFLSFPELFPRWNLSPIHKVGLVYRGNGIG